MLHLGGEDLTLEEFQSMLAGRCEGRVIYMGSCETLVASDDVLKAFCRVTGASAIAGYTKSVDFVEAAAFEVLLLSDLAYATRMKPAFDRLVKNFPGLTGRLGFRMATTKWVASC
jgi:hypothetical protein